MGIDTRLNNIADDKQSQVNDELQKLKDNLLMTAGSLAGQKNPTLQDVQLAVQADFDNFNAAVAPIIASLAVVASISLDKAKKIDSGAKYTQDEIQKIADFTQAIQNEFNNFTTNKSSELATSIYQQVVAGASREEIKKSVEITLNKSGLGGENIRGLKTLVVTRAFDLDSFATKLITQRLGVEKYRYVGGVIDTTRDWCRQHNDKVLTKSEIDDWRNHDWQGKQEGDPFVVRGGWNCRHHFEPVPQSGK